MTPEELQRKNADKPQRQPRDLQKMAKRVKSLIKQSRDSKMRKSRIAKINLIEDLLYLDNYWVKDLDDRYKIQIDNTWYPKFAILQMILEEALPKVMNQDYKPTFNVTEGRTMFRPSGDQAVQQMKTYVENSGLNTNSLADAAAEMLNAKIAHHANKVGMDHKVRDLARNVLALGEYWTIDGYSGGDEGNGGEWDLCHPRDMYSDPYARSEEQVQWRVYRVTRSLEQIYEAYPEWAHLVRPSTTDAEGLNTNSTRTESEQVAHRDETEHYDETNVMNSRKDLYCAWVKAPGMKKTTQTVEVPVADAGLLRQFRERGDWEQEEVYGVDPEDGLRKLTGWKLTREDERPEFASGWRLIIMCDGHILDDGSKGQLPRKASLPVKPVYYLPIDGSCHGRGLLELALDGSQLLNAFFKYTAEDVAAGPVDVVDESKLQTSTVRKPTKQEAGQRRQTWYVDIAKTKDPTSVSDVIFSLPAGETSASLQQLIETVRAFTEWLTGIKDPAEMLGGNPNAPAEAIRDMRKGSNSRMGPIQESLKENIQATVRNWAYYWTSYEKDPQTYKQRTLVGQQLLEFAPYILGQFDWDIEVRVGRGTSLPDDPEQQAQFLGGLFQSLLQQPKAARDIQVHLYDFPFEKEMIESLDAAEAQMKQAAQEEAAAQQGPDPAEIEIKKQAAQSITDSLEAIVSDEDLPIGIRSAALVLQGQMMTGTIPTPEQLSGVFEGIDPGEVPAKQQDPNRLPPQQQPTNTPPN